MTRVVGRRPRLRTRGSSTSIGVTTMLVVMVVIIGTMGSTLAQRRKQPRLVIDRAVVELGTMRQGDKTSKRLAVRNAGDVTAKVLDVRFDCGCATGKIDRRSIPAGQKAYVSFTFDSTPLEGDFKKTVEVIYERPGTPWPNRARATLKGSVQAAWSVVPVQMQIGSVRLGQRLRRTFELKFAPTPDQTAPTLTPSRLGEALQATIQTTKDGVRQLVVDVTVPKTARPGALVLPFTVRADSGIKRQQQVTLVGHVEGDLEVAPRHLRFGRTDGTTKVTKPLVIESRSGRLFRVTRVVDDGIAFIAGVVNTAGARHELTFEVVAGLPVGRRYGIVVVHTDHPDEPKIILRYDVEVVKATDEANDGGKRSSERVAPRESKS